MRVNRRRVLSGIGTTAATGLVCCTTTNSPTLETESPTPTETSTTGTENPSSRELKVISKADSCVSLDQQLIQQSDEATVYGETYTYRPGAGEVLSEPFKQGETYEFKMRTPSGDLVFEGDLYSYVSRLEVTIQSTTEVEQTGITEI